MDFEIVAGDISDLDDLEDLWLEMLSHHRGVIGRHFPIRPAATSWDIARAMYRDWLTSDRGILRIARLPGSSEPVGYGLCKLVDPGPTFELGPFIGDVDSLVVTDTARGSGIGGALLQSIREELVAHGISYWSIGVIEGNTAAESLYRRVGFRPWNHSLLAETERSGEGDLSPPGLDTAPAHD